MWPRLQERAVRVARAVWRRTSTKHPRGPYGSVKLAVRPGGDGGVLYEAANEHAITWRRLPRRSRKCKADAGRCASNRTPTRGPHPDADARVRRCSSTGADDLGAVLERPL